MKQLQIDIMVWMFLSWVLFAGQVFAGPVDEPSSSGQGLSAELQSQDDPKKTEISRLQQDLATSKAKIQAVNEENMGLQSKMDSLKSRIQELKRKLLEEKPVDVQPER